MKAVKRLLCTVICLLVVLGASACGQDNKSNDGYVWRDYTSTVQPPPTFAPTDTPDVPEAKVYETVYVSKSGKKIHRSKKCSGMKYFWTMTEKEAIQKGYTLCENCY